ncbi:hypothetical protein [Cryptosporangium sp. NPDC048952]|uniref:hypothetical protein n=1 Tax=Cryptosporangium sp. NPDC048952 TaxID=3363961 RepID=UPI00371FF671
MTSQFGITGLSSANRENSSTLLGWQLAQRIQLTVNQVARLKRDAPVEEIVRELDVRLRRFGVFMTARELTDYATGISETPG